MKKNSIMSTKLFGLFNVLDLLIILVVVALGAGMFFKSKGFDTATNTTSDTQKVIVKIKVPEKDLRFYNNLKKDLTLIEKTKYMDGKLVDFTITPSPDIQLIDGKLVQIQRKDKYDAFVTLELNARVKGPILSFGEQEVRIGTNFWIYTDNNSLLGFIYEMEQK